jgi:hypothetical protein
MAVQVLLSQQGPLPINISFQPPGDMPMYIEVNGSVWTQNANTMTGIQVAIDGNVVGTANIFSNTPSTHRAVVPAYIPITLDQGQHTLALTVLGGTISDANDLYTAVIHY